METLNDKYLWNSDLLETITEGTSSRYWECKRIEIDSRKVKKGDLFLALKGKNFDGHDFILDSMRSGASAAMVTTDFKVKNKNQKILTAHTWGKVGKINYFRSGG